MEYSMEFHGTLVPPNEISLSSMEFHGTLRLSLYSIPCYPRLSWDIPWNSMELWSSQIKTSPSSKWFHGIRRGPFQMTQVFHGIPWNSMELRCRQMKYHLVPWNSMELWDCHFIQYHIMLPRTCMGYSMEFHGTLESPNIKSRSSMGFHGIIYIYIYIYIWNHTGVRTHLHIATVLIHQ